MQTSSRDIKATAYLFSAKVLTSSVPMDIIHRPRLKEEQAKGSSQTLCKISSKKDVLLKKLGTIDGIGEKSILGIAGYEDFDAFTFADDIAALTN